MKLQYKLAKITMQVNIKIYLLLEIMNQSYLWHLDKLDYKNILNFEYDYTRCESYYVRIKIIEVQTTILNAANDVIKT